MSFGLDRPGTKSRIAGHFVPELQEERMYRIFVVEDDRVIAREIKRCLEAWGLEVAVAADFREIPREFAAFQAQLVILDISLPFFDGYHWCREIRKISKVPILFLSSASDNMNIVMAMTMGGDDFIAKPFDLSVLTAKVQALLRRAYEFQGAVPLLQAHGAILNPSEATLSYSGQILELTKNDLRILQTLMERSGEFVSREEIMTRLWESDSFVDDNALTVNVTRLRRKLESIGLTGFIETKKGVGYRVK